MDGLTWGIFVFAAFAGRSLNAGGLKVKLLERTRSRLIVSAEAEMSAYQTTIKSALLGLTALSLSSCASG